MDIRSIKVDFDKGELEINGARYEDPIIVYLPGQDGWNRSKLYNILEMPPQEIALPVLRLTYEEVPTKDSTSDKIRKARTEKGLTQKQLAELAGLSEETIYEYESETDIYMIDTMGKIADALSVPMNQLLTDDSEMVFPLENRDWIEKIAKAVASKFKVQDKEVNT